MEVQMENEVNRILESLRIDLLDAGHPLLQKFDQHCSVFRKYLLALPNSHVQPPLSACSIWELTPKCRFDALRIDIPRLANQLAFAVGFASHYLEHAAEATVGYFPNRADDFYWYHLDFGLRLASSGWDRIALLLDLAFELHLEKKCNLVNVLNAMPKAVGCVVQHDSFIRLKAFRDGRFQDLEAGVGRGARHETTHLLSPSTRFLLEFLDYHLGRSSGVPPETRRREWRDRLVEHHGFYLEGVQDAARLVSLRWPGSR